VFDARGKARMRGWTITTNNYAKPKRYALWREVDHNSEPRSLDTKRVRVGAYEYTLDELEAFLEAA
jgi:hypothetical protein